jgi:hypothetical protein
MLANIIGFLPEAYATPERTELVRLLNEELTALKSEYFSMLYGGRLKTVVSSVPDMLLGRREGGGLLVRTHAHSVV